MEEHPTLRVIAGHGVEGDRYANGTGHWSYKGEYVDEVTFIESEVMERVAAQLRKPFTAADSRRNIATVNIRLDTLIGQQFRIGNAVFEGLRRCDPCRYLDNLTGLPVRNLLLECGGLRARVLQTGEVAVGCPIV